MLLNLISLFSSFRLLFGISLLYKLTRKNYTPAEGTISLELKNDSIISGKWYAKTFLGESDGELTFTATLVMELFIKFGMSKGLGIVFYQ